MATLLTWRDTIGTLLPTLTYTEIQPGTPTAEQVAILWNDYGGATADTARRLWVEVLAKVPPATAYSASGLSILDQRGIEIRIIQGENITLAATGYKSCGSASWLQLPADLGQDEGIRLGIRLRAAAGEDVADYDIQLVVHDEPYEALQRGHFEANRNGILHRVGDAEASFFWNSPTVTANSPADNKVDISDVLWVHKGVPYCRLLEEVTRTLAAAGKERFDVITYGTSQTITSGSEVTAPALETDKPTPPTGEIVLAWLRVDETSIQTADIDAVGASEVFALSTAADQATVTGGQALIDGRFHRETEPLAATIQPSTTETLWRNPDGTIELATLSNRSDPRSLPLWDITSDGTPVETSRVDRRTYLDAGSYLVQAVSFAAVAAGQVWMGVNPHRQDLYLLPEDAIAFALHVSAVSDDPSSLGYSGGAWTVEVKTGTPGNLTTIFTSSGTDDRRPTIAYNATSHLDRGADPEVLVWLAGEVLEISVAAIPTGGGTPADGLTVAMRWRIPVG